MRAKNIKTVLRVKNVKCKISGVGMHIGLVELVAKQSRLNGTRPTENINCSSKTPLLTTKFDVFAIA